MRLELSLLSISLLLSMLVLAGPEPYAAGMQQIDPDSKVTVEKNVYGHGEIVYVSISDQDFNRDDDVREYIDLTQLVDGEPIVEIKILQPTQGTITLSALDGSIKDRNGRSVTRALESGSNTSVFEFEVMMPEDIEPNSSVTVLFHDPFELKTGPVTGSASVSNISAFLDTDKDEMNLGQDLTIILEEPDANIDSRRVDTISLNKILVTTDRFDETSLDEVLKVTGIQPSQSSLRETGPDTGVFEVTLKSINSKLADRNSKIRIIFFDDTPSGGGGAPIRVEKVVSVIPAKISGGLEKKEQAAITVTAPRVLDQKGDSVNSVQAGAGTVIQSSITNTKTTEQPLVLIIQIIDGDGFTSELSFVEATLGSGRSTSIDHQWVPQIKDMYTIQVFVWNSLTEPVILTPVNSIAMIVK